MVTQQDIDAAISLMVKADRQRQRAANVDLPVRQHAGVFRRHCARITRLAAAYEAARQHATNLKVEFRKQCQN